MATEESKPNWDPRVEGDRRLWPILPLVDNIYDALVIDEKLAIKHLIRLGDALGPHVESRERTIDIGEFIPMGYEALIEKRQFWSFVITRKGESDEDTTKYDIQRTDVWSGHGVALHLRRYTGENHDMYVGLSRNYGEYSLSLNRERDEWDPVAVLSKSVRGSASWKEEKSR